MTQLHVETPNKDDVEYLDGQGLWVLIQSRNRGRRFSATAISRWWTVSGLYVRNATAARDACDREHRDDCNGL